MKLRKRRENIEKLDKKKKIIIISSIVVVISIIIAIFVIQYSAYQKKKAKEALIKDITTTYSNYMKTTKKAILYDKNTNEVGKVVADVEFEVIKSKKKDFPYYRIKDSKYYIYFKDLKKIKFLNETNENDKYIILNKNIITKDNPKFYSDNKMIFTLNKFSSFEVQYIDEDKYYVKVFNKLFYLKKQDVKTVVDHENSTEVGAEYISIINYNVLADKCNSEDCVTMKSVEEQISYLNKNGYYPITISEYKNWLNGNIRLKPKAILLTTPNETNEVKSLNEKYNNIFNVTTSTQGMKFIDDNNKTTKNSKLDSLSRYNVKLDTSIEDFQRMSLGDHVSIINIKQVSNQSDQKIPVLNYHFFYDDAKGQYCGENICEPMSEFRNHLNYLRDNGYKTLTIEEFRAWLYGEIDLPKKSVLITIDDGAFGTGKHNGNNLIPILEEYNMHATLFLIAGWWDISNYRSPNLDIQSHTYDMHNTGTCGKAQVICANHDELLNDLQKSISIIGSNTAFCFPFYTYDEKSINVVKELGFKMSFVGGNRKASRSDNKYKIPRYPIYKTTTMDRFKAMVN